jgi:tetratricopeptide (TPR) repeat protein
MRICDRRPFKIKQPYPVRYAMMAWLSLASLTVVGMFVGCQESEPMNTLPNPLVVTDTSGNSDLKQALDFLSRMDEFDQSQAMDKILYHLQQWISKQPDAATWSVDPAIESLPSRFQGMVSTERLKLKEFEKYDASMLQEAVWMRGIARQVVESVVVPPHLASVFTELTEVMNGSASPELRQAALLFDWTVRNLQPDAEVQIGDTHRMNSDVLLYAWENVMMGRGTMEEKSRVFVLLARQLGLPVVMLAILSSDSEGVPEPWLPALYLDQQLYLFDMNLGVPVPGPDGKGIASLEQVVANPELLKRLNVLPDFPYPVGASELSRVVALVDATPAYLSHRMKLLESALVGQQKMVLTVAPSGLAKAVEGVKGVRGVGLWTLPYRAFAARSELQSNPAGFASLAMEHDLFNMAQTPLMAARINHFRGHIDSGNDRLGARSLYLESRTPDDQIQQIAEIPLRVPDGQEIEVTSEIREAHARRLANAQYLMRRTKQSASYWIALIAYERGQYQIAIDFLTKLTLETDSFWRAGAHYNLGRAQEALARQQEDPKLLAEAAETFATLVLEPFAAACHYRARRLQSELQAGAGAGEAVREVSEDELREAPPESADEGDSADDLPKINAVDAATPQDTPTQDTLETENTRDDSPVNPSRASQSSGAPVSFSKASRYFERVC